jgi:hypothetical protein
MKDTIEELDLPEENILTLLCYLELHDKKWIQVLSPVYTYCKVQCYKGARTLKNVSKTVREDGRLSRFKAVGLGSNPSRGFKKKIDG